MHGDGPGGRHGGMCKEMSSFHNGAIELRNGFGKRGIALSYRYLWKEAMIEEKQLNSLWPMDAGHNTAKP